MSATFYLSDAALRNLKRYAQARVDGISSSHLSEGIAAALGFRTHAALRSALCDQPTVEVAKPSNERLVKRLRELGYAAAPADLRLLPEFDRSYLPFRQAPLRKHRSRRWTAWRKLVVAGINAGLQQQLFGLSPDENWWSVGGAAADRCESCIYQFVIDGNLAACASVTAISGGELSVSIIANPRGTSIEPHCFSGLNQGDAAAHCWLERRLGAWVQDGGEGVPLQAQAAGTIGRFDRRPNRLR